MVEKYNYKDFQKLSWHEYQKCSKRIATAVEKFCRANQIEIDIVIPILRGGGPLSISLSHILNITKFYPCQYKYEYINNRYVPVELLSTIEQIPNKDSEHTILITEGNHVSGATALKCIEKVKHCIPEAKIIYVSVGRDYAHIGKLTGTIFETWGFLTNETKTLNEDECKIKKIKDKFVVYPWEVLEEEIYEVNSSLDYENGDLK